MERTLEDKKGHTGGHSSCEISNENHRLSAPVLGFYTEETSPLGFRENRRNWRRAGEVLTPLTKRCWLTNKQGRESLALCSLKRIYTHLKKVVILLLLRYSKHRLEKNFQT